MATTRKLPRVTEYIKNVGKSFAFASIDVVKENSPGIKEFIEVNDDIFRDVYSSVKNYRSTMRSIDRSIKQSNVYQAVEAGIKNMVEDAKTGKFYHDRTDSMAESALGLDEFNMDSDVSFDDNTGSSADSTKILSDSFQDAIGAAATSQNTIVAQSTGMMIQSNKASTKLIMAHMDKTSAAMASSIGSVYSAVSGTNAFLNGPMRAHLENSKRYYEESLKQTNEMNLMLKEMLEMQRNMYKNESTLSRSSKLDDSMNGDGSVDIRGYAKTIKSNIGEIADSLGLSSLKMDIGGGNPYMLLAANPFQYILGPLVNQMMSKDFKKALQSFDKGATSLFSQFIARMNTAKKNDDGSFMSLLGKIFGISIDSKDNIDVSKFKKDAVPFDGITRQSIIETIPGYLSRIEAALTGGGERHYDYNSGTWKSAKQIRKEFDDDRKRSIANASSDARSDIERNMLYQMEASGARGKKKAAEIRKSLDYMFTKIYEDGGDFRPNRGKGKDFDDIVPAYEYYGFKSEKDFRQAVKSMSRNSIRDIASNNMRHRQELSKLRRNQEANGGVQRQLFNGAYDAEGLGNGKRHNPFDKSGGTGFLAASADKHGRNIFWYLSTIIDTIKGNKVAEKIASEVKNNSIRTKSRFRITRKRSYSDTSPSEGGSSDDDPDGDYSDDDFSSFYAEIEREKARKQQNSKGLGDWISEKFGNSKIGQSFGKLIGNAEKIFAKPMEYMTKMLNKADEGMFKMMFGEKELTDSDGNRINGVFPFIVNKVKETFEELKEEVSKLFNNLKDKFKPLWDKVKEKTKPITDHIKNMGKSAWGYAKSSLGRTFDRFADPIRSKFDSRYRTSKGYAMDIGGMVDASEDEIRAIRKGLYRSDMDSKSMYKYSDSVRRALKRRENNADAMSAAEQALGEQAINELKRGAVKDPSEIAGIVKKKKAKDAKNENTDNGIVASAYGRYVTKRGLTMISPGEIIIPASFDKKEQQKMLALEKRDRSRIMKSIGLNASGTINTDEMKNNLHKIYEENMGKEAGSKNVASSIMGAGAGLLTGINPLLGAMAGAGISILNNSDTFKNIIFGKELEDGTREGGLIPKKISDFFKKALPDMGDFGLAGGLIGLLTPFGPLGGAAIGAGVGMLKNSEGFKKFIFGDAETGEDGLISKETAEKAKKFLKGAAPTMAAGAVVGALTGPFGLLGNAALGAGAGLIASSETFQNFLFGKKDENGKRGNGLFSAINTGILEPAKEKIGEFLTDFKEYTKKHILAPLKDFWKPFQQSIKNTITGVGEKVKDFLNDMFEKKMGLPIADFLQEKIFKPLTNTFFKILKAPLALGKAVLSAPFKALGFLGNNMRMRQIEKGSAHDMSASERLAWREQHKFRSGMSQKLGRDKMLEQDQLLAGMDEEQLRQMSMNSRAGLEGLESLQRAKGKARIAVGDEFSRFFNEKDSSGKNRYSRVNYTEVRKKLKKIEENGNYEEAVEIINGIKGLSPEEKSTLLSNIKEKLEEVKRTTETYDLAKKDTKETDAVLEKLLGRKIKGRKDRRQLYKTAEAELKARARAAKAEEVVEEDKTPEVEAVDDLKKKYEENSKTLIDQVKEANENLKKLLKAIRPDMVDDDKGDSENSDGNPSIKGKKFNFKRIIRKISKGGVATADEFENNDSGDEDSSGEEDIVASAYGRYVTKTGLTMISPGEIILSGKGRGKGKRSLFRNIGLNAEGTVDEDSKEATDARKEAEEKENDEKSANNAERESASWLRKLYDKFFGDDKDKKNKGSGLLSKIGSAIGGVFQFLGGSGSVISKIGLGVAGIGGVSLLGHASKWIKDSFWPKLKEILFGTTDADGNKTSSGLLGGIAEKFKIVMFGDPNDPESGGIWGKFKDTEAGKFISSIYGGIKSKGFWGYVADDVIPTMIDKLVVGWGYAMENIAAPLITAILKNLPSLLASTAKALIKGIGAAIFKSEIKRDGKEDVTADTSELSSIHGNANSRLASGTSSTIKSYFSTNINGGKTSASVNWDHAFDSNDAAADETYDAEGNHLNKTGNEILWEKDSGIGGLFGKKRLTNDIYYDENGNIGLDAYYRMNEADSLASATAEAAGRSFVQGSLGFRNPLFNKMAKTKIKGKGKGLFGNGKGIYGTVKTGVKTGVKGTGAAVDSSNKAGLNLYQFGAKNLQKYDFIDDVIKEKGLSGKEAKALRKQLEDKLITGKIDSNTASSIIDDVLGGNASDGLRTKLDDIVANKPVATNTGKISNAIKDKWHSSKVGSTVDDAINGVKGVKNKITNKVPKYGADDIAKAMGTTKDDVVNTFGKSFKYSTDDIAKAMGTTADDAAEFMTKNVTKPTGVKAAVSNTIKEKVLDPVKSKVKNVATKGGAAVRTAAGNAIDVAKNTKAGAKIAGVVDDAKGIIGKIAKNVKKVFSDLAENNKFLGFFTKALKNGADSKGLKNAIIKIGSKIADSALGKIAKKALTKVASVFAKFAWPILIAQCIASFIWGYDNADTILGVAKGDEYQVNFGQKCVCGLVHLVNEQLLLGLIPTDVIMDIVIEFLFPLFGLNAEELNAARDRADQILDEWNKAHPDETYSNLEDFNNKDKWFAKAGRAMKKGFEKAGGKIKEVAGKAWDKTKEIGGKAIDLAKKGFSAVADKTKEVVGGALDIGRFIKDCVANTIKAAIDPEYSWSIDDYIKEDDPLGGAKKVIYQVMRIPMGVVGVVAKIGKVAFDKIKGFAINVKDGFSDACQDIAGVAKGEYSVFSKQYWQFNDKDEGDNPLGIISKVASTALKVVSIPHSMVGYIGSKIWQTLKKLIAGGKEGALDASKDVAKVIKGEHTIFNKDYWQSDSEGDEENSLSTLGKIFGIISRVVQAPTAMLGYVGSKIWQGFKAMISGAKEGILDASSDVKAVRKGQYTVFSKNYWDSDRSNEDNPISKLGSIFGFVSRVFQAPSAMLGWVGTKVWAGIKTMISGAKEGILDAAKDVGAVMKGEYTVFNGDYWKANTDEENPISKVGSIFGFVSRVFQAAPAMLGWVGTKVWTGLKALVSGAKEGILDASTDVKSVMKGQYTIFNSDYWKSNTDEDNPISKVGSIFGFVSRVFQAPSAMLGWVGSKVWQGIKTMIEGAKEGTLDASKDVAKVIKGEHTIFTKDYWQSDSTEDNPISTVGSIFGFVSRVFQAPGAMLGWVGSKVAKVFKDMIDGAKDITEDTQKVIDKAEKGDISVFDKEYWKVTVDEDNPLGLLGKIGGFIQRVFNAPIILVKSLFKKITGLFDNVKEMFSGIGDAISGFFDWFGDITGGGEGSGEGRGGKGRIRSFLAGRGHAYQSDRVIANMRYGDSTIADSGCAPVAATNLINNINPNTMDVGTAAAYAEKNKLTIPGGGTDIRYFNKFLGSQGIATANTKNKNAITEALRNGNQVIMLGRDTNNSPGVPFGTNPHFITATGIDKNGNIIVEDPDLPQSSVSYKKNTLFKSMMSSIIADGSKVKSKKSNKHGLGSRRRLWGGSGDEEAENEVSVDNLMGLLGDLGTSAMKYAFGDAYSALYGSEEGDDINSSSSSASSSGDNYLPPVDLTGNDNAEKIWNFLRSKGYTPAGAAGIMGNLYAESGLRPNNIQNSFESSYGSDETYTSAVDSKSRGKESFAKDSAGYGLAQWTYHTRKRGLYEATVEQGRSIADLGTQLAYLDKELRGYNGLYDLLKSTNSVNTASDRVLVDFERPAVLNYDARRNYSNSMYNQFAGSGRADTGSATAALNSYGYKDTMGMARASAVGVDTARSVDYVTFLQTIVSILMNISSNTAILSKILELLSEKFNIDISRAEIEAARAKGNEQARSAIGELIRNNGGNNSSVAKLLNNQDTNYIFSVMSELARE